MRILAGQYKGKIFSAGNDLSIRPITNRTKEIIYSVLDDFCENKIVLDLFSGSGSLGFEALSRGAKSVTFVEKEISSIRVLKKNIKLLALTENKVNIIQSDALKFLKTPGIEFELILMDPPFKYTVLQELVNEIIAHNILHPKGILVVHHEINNPLLRNDVAYQLIKQKKIGRSIISFILQEETDD